MGAVIANMSMSLDGFIADPQDDVSLLFGWLGTGEVETATANEWVTLHTSQADADYLRHAQRDVGAIVVGRRLYDHTQGWGGTHPLGVPVFVVTHEEPADLLYPDAPFTFVTTGVADAVEQAAQAAEGKSVAIASATIAQQCLHAGLLDEIHVDLVPVLLGSGIRWFDNLGSHVLLDAPVVTAGAGVTHLAYTVRVTADMAAPGSGLP